MLFLITKLVNKIFHLYTRGWKFIISRNETFNHSVLYFIDLKNNDSEQVLFDIGSQFFEQVLLLYIHTHLLKIKKYLKKLSTTKSILHVFFRCDLYLKVTKGS